MFIAQTGPGIFFGGNPVVNGIVALSDISNTTSTALQCVTQIPDCCTTHGSGDWISPSGAGITTSTSSDMYQFKGKSHMDLLKNVGGMEGIYRCDIRCSPTAALSSFYVGVYETGNGI